MLSIKLGKIAHVSNTDIFTQIQDQMFANTQNLRQR